MTKKTYLTLLITAVVTFTNIAWADNKKAIAVEEISVYLEFSDYSGGVIFAEQIPKDHYAKMMLIDTRDALQFAKNKLPGAINIEWRKVLEQSKSIPKDKMVLMYCNTGALSAQAGFALRMAGWDNVRILHGGMDEWATKGGVEAQERALKKAPPSSLTATIQAN
jgi:rhodanese-related sulfurtransferase